MIEERKLLLCKADDMLAAIKRGRTFAFTPFLSLDERIALLAYFSNYCVKAMAFGGYNDSERCIIGICDTEELDDYVFPIDVLRFSCRDICDISHRDVLGSLMSLGVKREMFGDILNSDNWWYIICVDKISDYIMRNFSSVKNCNISLERYSGTISFERVYDEKIITVMSMRLDCVVSYAICVSRTVAAELISSGNVVLNGEQCLKKDKVVKSGDVFSVRKKGKYRIADLCGRTKKDRLKLKILKYI